jgi:hypothetical protein
VTRSGLQLLLLFVKRRAALSTVAQPRDTSSGRHKGFAMAVNGIPANDDYASLSLGSAVMIHCSIPVSQSKDRA